MNCIGEKSESYEYCWHFVESDDITYEDFFKSFPLITFVIQDQLFHWKPENYMYEEFKDLYCFGVKLSSDKLRERFSLG